MKKIEPQLAAMIADDPGKIYAVVIVCSSDNKLREMEQLNRLMDHIYSGKLSGSEINDLMLQDEVLSIELDKTITIE